MEKLKRELIKTEDGSSSLYIAELDETYHNRKGAITESKYIYIERGLIPSIVKNNSLRILELGMGTGLNVLLSALEVRDLDVQIEYHSIEAFPLVENEWRALNYVEDLKESQELFERIHFCSWNEESKLTANFSLHKHHCTWEDFEFTPSAFDLAYFDAFAPSRQPELWSEESLTQLFDLMSNESLMVTYCAQGQFKRTMRALGFDLEHPPGPMGKKEMTVARKSKKNPEVQTPGF